MALSTPVLKASATPVATVGITSASFTPAANALVVVVDANTGSATTNVQGTISSTHSPALTWTVGGLVAGGNTTGAVRWWYATAGASPGAGTVTVTLPVAPTIQDLMVFETTGHNTTTPITGHVTATATTATTISATLAAAPVAADLSIGIATTRNKTTVPTIGTGYTSLDSGASATPSATYLVEYRTASTSTAVSAAAVGTTWSGLIGFNIKAATGPVTLQVDGISTATATATGTVASRGVVSGVSAATATATGTVVGRLAVTGVSAAAATATGDVSIVTTGPVTYQVDGVSTATATATGTVVARFPVTGISNAVATATGTVLSRLTVAGTSTATASATGAPVARLSVVGVSAATTTALGDVTRRLQVTGISTATSTAVGTVAVVVAGKTVLVNLGAGWVSKPVMYHNGSVWVQATSMKRHNGSAWVETA